MDSAGIRGTSGSPRFFWSAVAAIVPNTRAIAVAVVATRRDRYRASTAPLFHATPNHSRVRPGRGKRKAASSVVNARDDQDREVEKRQDRPGGS